MFGPKGTPGYRNNIVYHYVGYNPSETVVCWPRMNKIGMGYKWMLLVWRSQNSTHNRHIAASRNELISHSLLVVLVYGLLEGKLLWPCSLYPLFFIVEI